MDAVSNVIKYQCPCCGAGLRFGGDIQQLKCEYCDNEFELSAVRAFNESQAATDTEDVNWDRPSADEWSQEEHISISCFRISRRNSKSYQIGILFCNFNGIL